MQLVERFFMSRSFFKRKLIHLYAKIVREKATPEYIARGWAIGMFYGCLIPFGFQLICSIPTAFLLKGSKVGATVGTFFTNHFSIFIIYPLQCWVGNRLMGGGLSFEASKQAMKDLLEKQNYDTLLGMGWELVASFFIGGALLTAVMTPLTYVFVKRLVMTFRAKKEAFEKERKEKAR
jgi:uncharacterized protein (DUF2062 family)